MKQQEVIQQQQHDQAQKDRICVEAEKQREKEEEELFDTAQHIQQQNQEATPIPNPQEVTTLGTTPMETDEARGEESTALMERKQEQERRQRASLVGQIDMNAQSDMMASFEEMIH